MTAARANQPEKRPRDDRGLPADIPAEEALLGAAITSPDAALHVPDPRQFFKPNHQFVADAIRSLLTLGHPVDPITVADELRRAGLLDQVGGMEALLTLANSTPAISNAGRYAQIVTTAWQQRQVLWQTTQIADVVYNSGNSGDAVGKAIDVLQALTTTKAGVQSNMEVADLAAVLAGGLDPVLPAMFERSDGANLIYAGKMHSLVAESTSGKSWVAVFVIMQILIAGGCAIYLDWEDTARSIVDRLLAVGATPDMIVSQFKHVRMHGGLGPVERAELKQMMDDLNPDLIVIDAWIGSLNAEGLNEEDNNDVETWANKVPRWLIAESGAAVWILDHVVKNPEERGRYGRGAGHKLNVLDGIQYLLKPIGKGFSKTQDGWAHLVCGKDRGGNFATGEIVAAIHFEPAGNGKILTITVSPYVPSETAHAPWKPTGIMRQIARALAESASPLSAAQMKNLFPNQKPGLVAAAIASLLQEGYVAESKGRGRSKTLRLLRPYGDSGMGPGPDPELFDGDPYEHGAPSPDDENVIRGPWADPNWSPPDEH